jgi:hypothetical protein
VLLALGLDAHNEKYEIEESWLKSGEVFHVHIMYFPNNTVVWWVMFIVTYLPSHIYLAFCICYYV